MGGLERPAEPAQGKNRIVSVCGTVGCGVYVFSLHFAFSFLFFFLGPAYAKNAAQTRQNNQGVRSTSVV